MSKTLSFSKDRVRVLVSTELDSVNGGIAVFEPTSTAVSSAKPDRHRTVSSVLPTSTAVSSVRPGGTVSSAIPSTAIPKD